MAGPTSLAPPGPPAVAGPADPTPRSRWQGFLRAVRGVMGADAYERYLQWHRTTHQPGEPMDVKEFWRHEYRRQEQHPGARCC